MKNITKIFAIALVVLGFASTSFAQNGVKAIAETSANIVGPISITKSVDLSFGNIAVNPTIAGTVVLGTTSARTAGGGVTLPIITGTVTAAKFTVAGESGTTFSITLPAPFNITGAGTPMTVDNFVSTPSTTGTLASGTQDIFVGATLNVAAGQTAGLYSNTTGLVVTVNYN